MKSNWPATCLATAGAAAEPTAAERCRHIRRALLHF
jgi:hypothetical protein